MFDFVNDLWMYMRVRKKFRLAPLTVIMVLLGTLILLSQGSVVAPFIHTLY